MNGNPQAKHVWRKSDFVVLPLETDLVWPGGAPVDDYFRLADAQAQQARVFACPSFF